MATTNWLSKADEWQDLNSVIEVTRKVHVGETVSEETSYYISCIRVGDAPQNLALFSRFAFNISKLSRRVKDSMKRKLRRAAWDDEFWAKLLFG